MPESDPQSQAEIEELVAEILARRATQGEAAAAAVCAAHPQHAAKIRRLLKTLDRIGMSADSRPPELPARLGDYRLLERIGCGGMGEVWLAEQVSLGRRVALKIMRPGLALFPRSRERFHREVEALTRLEHPAICRVYDAGEVEGIPYLAMQYLEGRTLAQLLAEEREVAGRKPSDRKTLDQKLAWIEEIARGLHAAHEQGFVHRDVKPGNMMITREDRAVLLDFGLARVLGGDRERLTLSGDRLGTPAYMAPEQITGKTVADRRSDVYALGVTLYEALSLALPFQGATREALYREILRGDASRLSWRRRGLPRELEVVVATAMDPDPDRRYQDALALAEDLARVRRREPVRARGLGRALRARRWLQRHPVSAVFLGMLGLALGVSLWFQVRLDGLLEQARHRAWVGYAQSSLPREPVLAAFLAARALRAARDREARFEACSALHRASAMTYLDRILNGHRGNVYGMDVSPDGRLLATGANDGTLALWELTARDRPRLWSKGLSSAPIEVCFCGSRHRRVLSAESHGRLVLWDLSGNPLNAYDGKEGEPAGFAHAVLSPDGTLLLAGFKGYARLFSLSGDRFDPLGDPMPHQDFVGALALDLERGSFATGTGRRGFDGIDTLRHPVLLWKIKDNRPVFVRELGSHDGPLTSLEFSGDGRFLLAAGKEFAWIYDLGRGEEPLVPARLAAGLGKIEARFLGPWQGGWRLATASYVDGRVIIWNERGGQQLSPGQVPARVNHIEVSADGEWFSLACDDGAARIFTAAGDRVDAIWLGSNPVDRTCFRSGRGELVAGFSDGSIRILRTVNYPQQIRAGVRPNLVAQAAPDGRSVLTAPARGDAVLWDGDGEPAARRPVWSGGKFGWFPACLAPDGRHFATLHSQFPEPGMALTVWETGTGEEMGRFDPGLRQICAAFLPGTSEVIVYGNNFSPESQELHLFDYSSGRKQMILDSDGKQPLRAGGTAMIASPDGRRVLHLRPTGLLEKEAATGKWASRTDMDLLKTFGTAGAFSPAGQIALGMTTGAIRLFDRDGRLRGPDLVGHAGQVEWLSFSPDGKLLASASLDGTARLWQADGMPVAELRAGEGPVYQANFAADGRYLYSAHEDGSVRRWFVHPSELLQSMEKWCDRVITAEEREKCARILAR